MLKLKPSNQYKKYSIFRIIGNEMPPRDEPDARLKTLKFILNNEPEFINTIKCWIVNCIHDKNRQELITNILSEKNQYFVISQIQKQKYIEANNKKQKINHAIAINRARNMAIQHGKTLSEFTFLLDGDCLFNEFLWNKTINELEEDQEKTSRKIYSIPTSRSTFEHSILSNEPMLIAEPMTIHRYDCDRFFNETIPFGEGDKLKFLYEIGHNKESGKHHLMSHEKICKSVGLIHHVTASDYKIEVDWKLRMKLRSESIENLLQKLDNQYFSECEKIKSNNYWSKIQGWFDFQGLYYELAQKQEDGCKIIEIGSWFGASIFYLAQEFKNRNKLSTKLYAIDTWNYEKNSFEKFLNNMEEGKVHDMITPIKMSSIEASNQFEEESIDVVFIDSSHQYDDVLNDIKAWYPKVKKGGIIGGHDYVAGHKVSESNVIKAVHKFFLYKNLEIRQADKSWIHKKI